MTKTEFREDIRRTANDPNLSDPQFFTHVIELTCRATTAWASDGVRGALREALHPERD